MLSQHCLGDVAIMSKPKAGPAPGDAPLKLVTVLMTALLVFEAWGRPAAAAQLSKGEALDIAAPWLDAVPVCGQLIPLGEFSFTSPEASVGGPRHELVETILALKKAGVVNVIDLPAMLGFLHFRVEINPSADMKQIGGAGPSHCLMYNSEPAVVHILSITSVQGGTTHWDGVIALATLVVRKTPLFMEYQKDRNFPLYKKDSPDYDSERVRMLFRFDPFTNKWKVVAVDTGPLDGDFFSRDVPNALRSD